LAEITSRLNRITSCYREELARLGIRVSTIFLCGSYALGTSHDDSDIDLIVISPDFAKLCTRERLELLGVAAGRIMEPVEAIGYTPEEIRQHTLDMFYARILEHEAIPV
jgi:predicted nucleotidyltransferase